MLHALLPLLLLTPQQPADLGLLLQPELIAHMSETPADELVSVIVVMEERYDLQGLIAETTRLRRSERRAATMSALIPFAQESQVDLLRVIGELESEGILEHHEMLWNVNSHRVTAPASAMARLARAEGVGYLHHDPQMDPEEYEDVIPAPVTSPLLAVPASLPYATSFESGSLDSAWQAFAFGAAATITSSYGPVSDGANHAVLGGTGGAPGFVDLVLHIDMSGGNTAILDFDLSAFGDSSDSNDGLFISDGILPPEKVMSFTSSSAYKGYSIDLGSTALAKGVALTSDFRVHWRWADFASLPSEGLAVDKISIVPQSFPVTPPEPNITGLQAPQLWDIGIEGQGALILNIDSGVEKNHPALAKHIWTNPGEIAFNGVDDDGNGKIDDTWGWDFASNDNNPADGGHGTNTAGIVMGDGTGHNDVKTGMAPNTTMAVARVGGEGDALAAYQYAITIGADCITSSHSYKYPSNPDYHVLRQASEAELAAGIIHANSIGNQGSSTSTYPIPYNVSSPGNNPGPWRHPQQLQSGGISSVMGCAGIELPGDTLYTPSGQGPSAWEDIKFTKPSYPHAQNPLYWDYPFAGGSLPGLIKPDICTYTNVPTTSGSSGYTSSFGGTSAATPHLGGALCLMIDANESVPPRQISQALQETVVDLGPVGKDLRFGAGKLQVYDAAMRILGCVTAYPINPVVTDTIQLDVTGPVGDAWYLVYGFGLATSPSGFGFDFDIVAPQLLASGVHTGPAAPTTVSVPLSGNPGLSGLVVYTQLVTNDFAGLTGGWLVSLVETISIQ